MSIVRQGLAEDKKFGAGYDAIFGGKASAKSGAAKKPAAKKASPKKKPAKKK